MPPSSMNFFAASLLAAALGAAATLATAQTIEQGGLLRDRDGRTLYVFDKDSEGRSHCHDGCLAAWPAFVAREGASASGDHTLHARPDGRLQWGWKGRPLYYYAADAHAGDALGDGMGGTWHVVRAQPRPAAAPPAPAHYGGYGY